DLVTGVQTCALPIYADAVEDAADRGLGMDRGEGTLPRAVGLGEDALQVVPARGGIPVLHDQPLLAVGVHARPQSVAVLRVEVVRSEERRVGNEWGDR